MFQQSSLSFLVPKFRETRAPFLLAGAVLTSHTMGKHTVCSVADGRVPRQL